VPREGIARASRSACGPRRWRVQRRCAALTNPRRTRLQRAALPAELSRQIHPVTGSGAAQSLRPISALEAQARRGFTTVPLRLCPHASVPSDSVSRCTWPRPGAAHIPRRPHLGMRQRSAWAHPKWFAQAWSALAGATRLGKRLRDEASASTDAVSRQIVKEQPQPRLCDPTTAECADAHAERKRNAKQKTKRPGSSSGPGLCEQSGRVRLRAALPRVHSILMTVKRQIAHRKRQLHRRAAPAAWLHRHGMRERDPSLGGAGCCDDAADFHDAAFLQDAWLNTGSFERSGAL
jgi:hypothetical protein